MSIRTRAAHIASMANNHSTIAKSCTPYAAVPMPTTTEPPELDYKFFSPEFLDELDEHYRALAVGRFPA